MKSFFDRFKNKVSNARERVREYWKRSMNHSDRRKGSEGQQEANKLHTFAHKEQWRRNSKRSE